MTVRELKNMLNNLPEDFDEATVKVLFDDLNKYFEVVVLRKIVSPMGNPCCIELRVESDR